MKFCFEGINCSNTGYDGPQVSLSFQHFLLLFRFFFTFLQQFFTSLHHLFYFPWPFFKFPFRVSFLLPLIICFTSLQSFLLLLFTIFCTSLYNFFYFSSEFFCFTSAFLSSFYFLSGFLLLPFRVFLLPFGVFIIFFTYLQWFLLPFNFFFFLIFLHHFRNPQPHPSPSSLQFF